RPAGRPSPAGADLGPQVLVAAGDPAAGGEHRQGSAVDGHLLDQGQGGDDGGGQVVAVGPEVVDHLAVQALSAVDHGEEGDQGRWVVELADELGELLQGADRQGGGDQGDQQDVGGVDNILGDKRDAGWTVQDGQVVVVGHRAEQAADPLGRLLGLAQ